MGGADLARRLIGLIEGAGAAATALLTDFDGTLAPIVDEPAAAAPLPGTGEVLGRLAARLGVVAVVSGRPAGYLAARLPDAGDVVLAGLYGLERVVGGEVVEPPDADRWRPVVAAAADTAERSGPPGVHVERKGLAVALHVRTAPEQLAWVTRFAGEQAASTGLVAHPGRMSVELRPPTGGDKGSVVAELAAGRGAVAFIGDDRGDLPAFAALAELRERGVATVAVAVASDESPAELLARADVVVAGPAGVLAALAALADRLG